MWCEDCKHPIEAWGFALRTTFFITPHIGTYVAHNICAGRLLRTESQVRLTNFISYRTIIVTTSFHTEALPLNRLRILCNAHCGANVASVAAFDAHFDTNPNAASGVAFDVTHDANFVAHIVAHFVAKSGATSFARMPPTDFRRSSA